MKTFRLETLAIGDELLTGKTADTNSTFVGDVLFSHGLRLERVTVILDDKQTIQDTLMARSSQADFLICFGGLGPTTDDVTAETVAEMVKTRLVPHAPSRENLESWYRRYNRTLNEASLKQVLYPESGDVIPNTVGMAPGFAVTLGGCRAYFLPGVPGEMKAMIEHWVLPEVLRRIGGAGGDIQSHSWRLLGIPESEVQMRLNGVQAKLPAGAWLGYRTQFPENHLTLYFRGTADDRRFQDLKAEITPLVDSFCYTQGKEDLETVVLGELKRQGLKVAFAESCTAGLAAQRLTRVPGASAHVWGAVNVYTREAKDRFLGVMVRSDGEAVSGETSRRLAESLLRVSGCDVTAAITGFLPPAPEREGEIHLCVLRAEGEASEEKRVVPFRSRLECQWGASSYLLGALLRFLRK